MTELTPKQIKRLERLANLSDNEEAGVLEELNSLDDRIDEVDGKAEEAISIAKETQKMEGPKGDSPTVDEIRAIIEPLIPDPIPGKDYILTENDKEEIAGKIKVPVVEKIIEKTEVIKEQPIVTQVVKEVAIHEDALEIASKLNTEKEIVEQSVIIGLEDEIKKLREEIAKKPSQRTGMKKVPIIKRHNLSSQCDGITKSFSLPLDTMDVLGVFGTQFPINFNPGVDWTFSGRTLTLTGEVSAPQAGQTLYAIIETLFY